MTGARQDVLSLNGVDGSTGAYLAPGLPVAQAAALARGEPLGGATLAFMQERRQQSEKSLAWGWNPEILLEAGWGVIFAADVAQAVIEALQPLLAWRKSQAGDRYRQYLKEEGCQPQDTAESWLRRPPRRRGPGRAQPASVPYYLLLVGSPDDISFRFQYELGVNHAVGRLWFGQPGDFSAYAGRTVAAESAAAAPQARAVLFGVSHPGDRATQLSASRLVEPLAGELAGAAAPGWELASIVGAQATKAKLHDVLTGAAKTPLLLFTASHGVGFPADHPRQRELQGALLCQDWGGPLARRGPVLESQYFCADDIAPGTELPASISFHFGCYTAGTPKLDQFGHDGGARKEIARQPFLSQLGTRQLACGALGVVGHVDRAWSCSFAWPGVDEDHFTFRDTLGEVMSGGRLGAALSAFSQRHADIAVRLNSALEDERFGAIRDDLAIAGLWTANNDARSYILLGDPAVRFNLAPPDQAAGQPQLHAPGAAGSGGSSGKVAM